MKRNNSSDISDISCFRQSEMIYSFLVRTVRKIHGLTQIEVAHRTDLSNSYVSNLEFGHAYRNVEKTHRIVYAIDCLPETMLECAERLARLQIALKRKSTLE